MGYYTDFEIEIDKEPKQNIVEPRDFEHPTTKGAKDFVSCVEHYADLKQIPEGYAEHTGQSRRAILRSMTPQGFTKAFFEANKEVQNGNTKL